jgi:hypothetical protein
MSNDGKLVPTKSGILIPVTLQEEKKVGFRKPVILQTEIHVFKGTGTIEPEHDKREERP